MAPKSKSAAMTDMTPPVMVQVSVRDALNHDGEDYGLGDVLKLPEPMAAELVAAGVADVLPH